MLTLSFFPFCHVILHLNAVAKDEIDHWDLRQSLSYVQWTEMEKSGLSRSKNEEKKKENEKWLETNGHVVSKNTPTIPREDNYSLSLYKSISGIYFTRLIGAEGKIIRG